MSTLLAPVIPRLAAERPAASRDLNYTLESFFGGRSLVRRLPGNQTSRNQLKRFVRAVRAAQATLEDTSPDELKQSAGLLQRELRDQGLTGAASVTAMAAACVAVQRALELTPFDTQIVTARLIHCQAIAEMQTGEGKSIAAVLAAATAALAGIPVHVFSVNDYLTQRDADQARAVLGLLGVSVGCVHAGTPHGERHEEYARDVTFASNKELVFDYLRDRMTDRDQIDPLSAPLTGPAPPRRTLRGLHFAIVDEADSILIDEARTPLVISRNIEAPDLEEMLRGAYALAEQLDDGDFLRLPGKNVALTNQGSERAEALAPPSGPLASRIVRETQICQALRARLHFARDRDYVVQDDTVQIVDPHTGRVMADRSWEGGLHQMIEIRENCPLTPPRETQARLSYQRFFSRYLMLGGTTGTAWEVRRELWNVYRLRTVRVAPRLPRRMRNLPPRICMDREEHDEAVVQGVLDALDRGQAVLVSTGAVRDSERLGQCLADIGVDHQILNAKQDAEEASIVARAGGAGCVTIATQMAGRGTDIKLEPLVLENGGLHVILTQHFEAARIDRQFVGRGARQGDPGSVQMILCIQHLDAEHPALNRLGGLLESNRGISAGLGRWLCRWVLRRNQRALERAHARARRLIMTRDRSQGELLSFTGPAE